jgi:hypothetical protein
MLGEGRKREEKMTVYPFFQHQLGEGKRAEN